VSRWADILAKLPRPLRCPQLLDTIEQMDAQYAATQANGHWGFEAHYHLGVPKTVKIETPTLVIELDGNVPPRVKQS
jgi:hypothetical protein